MKSSELYAKETFSPVFLSQLEHGKMQALWKCDPVVLGCLTKCLKQAVCVCVCVVACVLCVCESAHECDFAHTLNTCPWIAAEEACPTVGKQLRCELCDNGTK